MPCGSGCSVPSCDRACAQRGDRASVLGSAIARPADSLHRPRPRELIAALPPDARPLIATALPEASRVLSADALKGWVEGVKLLLDAGSGLGPVVSYLRTVHAAVRESDETLLPQIVGVCLSVLRQADPRALDAFLSSLPQAVRRLKDKAGLHGYLDLVDELAGLAPRGITPMFERLGQLLEQLSLDGLRRWSLLGVQGHTEDLAAQQTWFRLESPEARAILQAAGEGTLFTDVERRLAFYLRALWARQPDLRPATTRAGGQERQARVHRGRRHPHAAGLRGFSRPGSRRAVSRRRRSRRGTPGVLHAEVSLARAAADPGGAGRAHRGRARGASGDARDAGFAAPVAAVPRGVAELHGHRGVADGASFAGADRRGLPRREPVRAQGAAACSRRTRIAGAIPR